MVPFGLDIRPIQNIIPLQKYICQQARRTLFENFTWEETGVVAGRTLFRILVRENFLGGR
jgi:hypothetical protein